MKLSCLLSGFCCLVMVFACSVKEDRDECPCRLVLDFSDLDTASIRYAELRMTSQDGFVFADSVCSSEFSGIYAVDVPRGAIDLKVWYGADRDMMSSGGLLIPYGMEAPRIYMDFTSLDADCEELRHRVSMSKNHCVMRINVEGNETYPYSLCVRGNVNGYDNEGNPVRGEFSCVAYPDRDGYSELVLPRQTDNSLLLDIDDGTEILRTFALGEHIAASGYDWTVRNLEDISLDLDYYLSHLTLKIEGWDEDYTYDIVL